MKGESDQLKGRASRNHLSRFLDMYSVLYLRFVIPRHVAVINKRITRVDGLTSSVQRIRWIARVLSFEDRWDQGKGRKWELP